MFDPSNDRADLPQKPDAIYRKLVLRSLATPEGRRSAKKVDLDTPDVQALHARLMAFYMQEIEKQSGNRYAQALDADFYDHEQWTAEEIAELEDRGQLPIVYNVIATTVNWILGSERRMRSDFRVLPRKKDGAQAAQTKTEYLKYLSDVNRTAFARSAAFADAVKVGVGWIEDGVQDADDSEPVFSRQNSWRDMLWDSASTDMDLQNGRFMSRSRWIDLDILLALFPHRAEHLKLASEGHDALAFSSNGYGDPAMDSREESMDARPLALAGDALDYRRQRVRVIEMWFRKPQSVQMLTRGEQPGSDFAGEIYDPMSRGHWNELADGRAVVTDRTIMRTYVAIMTTDGLLHLQESPYRHNRFPFTPIWGYRRDSDGLPYGVIRGLRQMQRDINMRASKALWVLSTNKVLMEEGAVEDIDEFRAEAARPDAILVHRAGKKIELGVDRNLAAPHLELMSRSIQMVQQVGGVTDENLGRTTNATSGKAIIARQDQGTLATALLFDNLHYATQVSGEKQLSLVEQFVTDEKHFRVTNKRGIPKHFSMNGVDPITGERLDDITATKADFIIAEQPWSASWRQAAVQELMEMVGGMGAAAPQVLLTVIDLVVESMDLPFGDEIVQRLRQMTGARDPEQTEPTPEEMAKEQKDAEAEERAIAMEKATIAEKEASAQQKGAAAAKAEADTRRVDIGAALDGVKAQMDALQAALAAIQVPGAVPVADGILHEAGFKGRTENEDDAEVDEKANEMQQVAEAAMQAQQEQAAMAEADAAEEMQGGAPPAGQMPPEQVPNPTAPAL